MRLLLAGLGDTHVQFSCANGEQGAHNAVLKQYIGCLSATYNCYHPQVLQATSAERAAQRSRLASCAPTEADRSAAAGAKPEDAWQPRILHLLGTKPWLRERREVFGSSFFTQMWLRANASVPR